MMRIAFHSSLAIVTIFVAMWLLSCGGDDERTMEIEQDRPIAFAVGSNALTRAGQEPYRGDFLVTAKKMQASSGDEMVMIDYKVKYSLSGTSTDTWTYEGVDGQYLKYWDLSSSSYTFAAIAPIPEAGDNARIDENCNIEFSQVKGNIAAAKDWMIARTIRTKADGLKDEDGIDSESTLPDIGLFTDEVPLNFHHIMAKVEFYAYTEDDGDISLRTFRAETEEGQVILTTGDYDDGSGWTNQTEDMRLFDDSDFGVSGLLLGKTKETATLLASNMEIPQPWIDRKTLIITCRDTNGKTYSGMVILDETSNGTNSWEQNKHYKYILRLSQNAQEDQIILFSVSVNDWKWEEGNETESEEHNW